MATTSLKRLTKRLEIRPLQMRDDRAWAASHCAILNPKTPWELPRLPHSKLGFSEYSSKVLKPAQAELAAGTKYTLGIFHKEVGTLLGYVFIRDIESDRSSATLDFRLFNIYWGKGFAKEAVQACMGLSKQLKIKKFEIHPKSKGKLKL